MPTQRPSYPPTPRSDVIDDYHGTAVPDPYRWLEQPDSPETRDWVTAQNQLTEGWLEGAELRDAIRVRLLELLEHERFGVPFQHGGRYFYLYNRGLDNQDVLVTLDALDAPPRVLLDPNELSEDGTVSVTELSVSPDGRHLAYALSRGGSDWMTWHVRSVEDGRDLADEIPWCKFSGAAWSGDSGGFYYCAYEPPDDDQRLTGLNENQRLFYHRLDTDPAEDELVYERPEHKEWGFSPEVTDDGRYLVIQVSHGTAAKNRVLYRDLTAPGSKVTELIASFDHLYDLVGSDGPRLWFRTDDGAARERIVAIDLDAAEPRPTEVVAERAEILVGAAARGGRLIASYLADARSRVLIFRTDGTLERELELPGIGTAHGFPGRLDEGETFFGFTSFTTPTAIYRYDVESGEVSSFRRPAVPFEPDAFETSQVFYTSADGTRVPMFLAHRRGLKLDGTNPTYLYGYGGFKISLTAGFSVSTLVWMEMGGVLAVPNLRGGGEYGEPWHEAGTVGNKQNVFDDFIAAARWLEDNRYTSAARTAIGGGSNGGLLVGACLTQHPERFAAAMASNGVHDMLRYHKWTIGWAWASDYGTSDDPTEFEHLVRYSPVHNTRPGASYPAVLIMTADHDDRVVPAHSYKFAAALQHAQAGDQPILIRIDTKAGHGAGKPTDKLVDELCDRWAFISRALGGLEAPRRGN